MYTVRQKRWLYSDVRYVKWASFETSYNGIKYREKKLWTLGRVGVVMTAERQATLTTELFFYPTWLHSDFGWKHKVTLYFSEHCNSQTLWVYRTVLLAFSDLHPLPPPFPRFFFSSLYGFSEVNRHVSRHCSWKDERDVQMFWTRAKVLSVCYSS